MDFTTSTAPWFYVALLAGIFTLIGALVSAVGTWVNEAIKASRANTARVTTEMVALSAKLLRTTDQMRETANKRLSRSDHDYLPFYRKDMPALSISFDSVVREYYLSAPASLIESKESKKLIVSSFMLAFPTFTNEEIRKRLDDHQSATTDYRNIIRKLQGLKPLKLGKSSGQSSTATEELAVKLIKLTREAYANKEELTELQRLLKGEINLEPAKSEETLDEKSTPVGGAPASDPEKS